MRLPAWLDSVATNNHLALLAGLVILAAIVLAVWRLRVGSAKTKGQVLRLRSAREQAKFEPVRTVYHPKGYRRPRS